MTTIDIPAEKKKKNGKKAADWKDVATESAATEHAAAHPPETYMECLPVKLTPDEIIALGDELAATFEEMATLEAKKKAASDRIKAEIELVESRAKDLAASIRKGTEDRPVEVTETFIFATNTAEVRRADNGELVSTRALRSEERQTSLSIGEAPNGALFDRETGEFHDDGSISDPDAVLGGEGV